MPEGRPFWADDGYTARKPLRVSGGIQIHSTRGTVAQTWWSKRFLDVLTELGVGGRLSRGRSYARSGQIVSLDVAPGAAVALVQGTRPSPYRVRIGMRTWDKAEWVRAEQAMAEDAWYAAGLLAGAMPPEIEELLEGLGLALFPGEDLSMDCTCPDVTVPCKHLAAVFYLLAERFDSDPFELLALRGRDRESLLDNLRHRRGAAERSEGHPSAARAAINTDAERSEGYPSAARAAINTAERSEGHPSAASAATDTTPGGTPALADVLNTFFTGTPAGAPPPAPPVTSPDAVLDQVPEPGVRVGGKTITDLLRPVYRRLADDD